MTIPLRRPAATAGVVLSVLGLLMCLAGVAGVWAAKKRVDRVAAAVFATADDAFEFMQSRLGLVKHRIDSARPQIDGLAARAQRLQATIAEPEVRAETESLRLTLDMVVNELKAAETWLDSIEAVARGVNSAAASIAESKQAAASASASGMADEPTGATAARIAELAGDLAEAINRLDALRAKLLNMRENRVLAREFAEAAVAEAAELDARLARLSTSIDDFDLRVSIARASSMNAGQRFHGWITLAAVLTALILLWFCASQVCTMRCAWRLARRSPAS